MDIPSDFPGLLCGVQIRVLPDFLLDHTLLNEDLKQRLVEFHGRWVQFIERLWQWKNTTFCLRFLCDPKEGAVRLFLLARAASLAERVKLRHDIEFALEAYGIMPDVRDSSRCLRLLSAGEIDAEFPDAETRVQVRRDVAQEFAAVLQPPTLGSATWSITQEVTDGLWKNSRVMSDIEARFSTMRPPGKSQSGKLRPWLPLIYHGPAGSFLVPFKALASSPVRATMSIYLAPTLATDHERVWVEFMGIKARQANQANQEQRDIDPAAEPVERLCTRIVGNVLRKPFLVSVLCAAVEEVRPTAEMDHLTGALARTMQAVCCERKSDDQSTEQLRDPPPGSAVTRWTVDDVLQREYRELQFPLWQISTERSVDLARLDYLCDSRGAATVFRLPVSTRGGVCGVEVRQPAPTFVPGPSGLTTEQDAGGGSGAAAPSRPKSKSRLPVRTILLGRFEGAGDARLDVEALVKHTLITGFTGSGKTTTILHLLHRLWHLHPRAGAAAGERRQGPNGGGVPFMVIESAKQEYRGLLGIPAFKDIGTGLLIYTLGNETVAPFRLNPFALLPGIRVEAHVSRLQACFEAALPPLPFLPSVLAESLEAVYKRQWWTLTDVYDPAQRRGRRFPRLSDFYAETERVLKGRGYAGDVGANVVAATKGRIKQLLIGSMGFMLEVEDDAESVSPERLFTQPAVLELNDLNHQDKALVMMFLLTLLREYRELHPANHLAHVTVIEEAHNVLGQVESQGTGEGAGADTRAKSVEAFCNMLAEVRSLGQGLVISDQSPNKLAPDAMRNTNVQIAHQLRDSHDRESIANAMIMDDEQRDFLGKLPPGQAAVFFTGLQKATFFTAPDYRGGIGALFTQVSDGVVRSYMMPLTGYRKQDVPFAGCKWCGKRRTCDYRSATMAVFADPRHDVDRRYKIAMKVWQEKKNDEGLAAVAGAARDAAKLAGNSGNVDAAWCCLVHGWSRHAGNWNLHVKVRNRFVKLCEAPGGAR